MVDKKTILVYHLTDGKKQVFAKQTVARAIRKKYPEYVIVNVTKKIIVRG